ncbi:MAG: CHASE2 domain-containing protein [Candidatus Accumulibacter sp.]|jgi:CHASE2 domain-containing sensor protein/nitrogen-specific signal transduction histidine kinase|nr:CHASE2 domain-containing protein [Accumulibacter sp.]
MREKSIVILILLVIALTCSLSGALQRIDHMVFDLGQMAFSEPIPDDVLLVTVDEHSLDRLGRWPWSRQVHARLLDALCRARPAVVGFDVAFPEPQSPEVDERLAQAIRRCGMVVLPLVLETESMGGQVIESPPIPILRDAAAGLGRVGVRIDEGGMARSVDLEEGVGAAAWPLFAAELLRVGGEAPVVSAVSPPAEASYELVQDGRRRLRFAGPPGSFPHVSYADALEGRVPAAMIVGRTILVGAAAVGLGDQFSTPVSANALPMAGVEIQANVWLGLRTATLVREMPPGIAALFSVALALVPLSWLPRLMPSSALFSSLAWMLFPVAFSVLGLTCLQWWFPPMSAVLASFFAYPLWSWRRLEVVRRDLDFELRELAGSISGEDDPGQLSARKMGFEQRIAQVQTARQRVRQLEEQRRETLAFISHDLHVPLSCAVQRLESGADCRPEQLLPSLRRAQSMAQDFLHLARAKALDRKDMKTLDLIFLLHQAADELFLAARDRGMRIERNLPAEPLWVVGDFDAIERCAINLLQNAVTHGLSDSSIVLETERGHRGIDGSAREFVRFWVENAGGEYNPEQLSRVFEKFRRGKENDPAGRRPKGAGLGLYYVRTVAAKHGGRAGAEPGVEGKIRFWVELPLAEASMSESHGRST